MSSAEINILKKQEGKKWLWVPCPKALFKPGYVLEESLLEVKVQSNTVETFKSTDVFKMNPTKFDRIEDLASLSHLNEPSVLHNLQIRYLDSHIYTYSGLFLIALNPYKSLGIYSNEFKDRIPKLNSKRTEPHIFSLANEAYTCLLTNHENQSILITGESGAGKTENTKKVIEYIAYIAGGEQDSSQSIESLLLCANPILEAFGNAKTIKNDNSSRFGKFIQMKFKGGKMCGARIDKYLLERSRLTHQNKDERSYHIFYYLLKGASASLLKDFYLTGNPSDYHCLRNSCFNISGIDDTVEFNKLENYFNQMGIEDSRNFYRFIAGILHLSNINFTEVDDAVIIENEGTVEIACRVLNISLTEFVKTVLYPTIKAGTETVTHYRSVDECYKLVEGFIKLIYESLFESLVSEINCVLDRSFSDRFIGVLDIAGFEIFEKNSYEQLSINYTNEKLQQFFNHHMFVLEQEVYKNECIDWNFIDFGLDLEPTIKIIEGNNPIGILSYLDEECVMPQANDRTLLDKIRTIPSIEKCPFKNSFKLRHYAGLVEYEIDGWVDKNKDIHSQSLHNLIAPQFKTKFNDSNLKTGIFRTVGQSHRENLRRLMAILSNTKPHFVRCILPNLQKSPEKFNKKLILDQLRCNGVLEGIRISRLGYPSRITFSEFNERYLILLNDGINTDDLDSGSSDCIIPKNLSVKILNAAKINQTDFKIGNSLIFLKQGILADIEDLRNSHIEALGIGIQSVLRDKIQTRKNSIELERSKAISLLLKNAAFSINFLRWKWWSLFIKIKPLLEAQKNTSDLKEKEEQIKAYSELVNRERLEKKELDERLFSLQNNFEELKNSLELANAAIEDKENLMVALRNENSILIKSSDSNAKIIDEIKEMLIIAEKKESNHNEKFELLNREIFDLKQDISSKGSTIESLIVKDGDLLKSKETEISNLKKQISSESSKILERETEIKSKDVKIQQANSEIIEKDSQIQHLHSENDKKTKSIASMESAIKKLKNEIDDISFSKESLQGELMKSVNLSNEITRQLNNSQLEVEYFKTKSSSLEQSNKNNLIKIEELENQLVEQSIHKDGTHETISNLQKQIKTLNLKMSNLENLNSSLVKEKDELYEENQKLAKEKIEALCKSDIKENQERKSFQFEIQKLKIENDKLKSELTSSTSFDEGMDGLIEKLNKTIENEKSSRKLAEKRQNELETEVALLENKMRTSDHAILGLEERNLQLVHEYCNNFVPKADLLKAKDQFENLRCNFNEISQMFQTSYFNLLKSMETQNTSLVSEIENLFTENASLKTNFEKIENLKLLNQKLVEELEGHQKSKNILKTENDNLQINSNVLLTEIKELKEHIKNLENNFNERENEIEIFKETYNSKVEIHQKLEFELKEKLKNVGELVSKLGNLNNSKIIYEDATKVLNKKINELSNEIIALNSKMLERDIENEKMRVLIDTKDEYIKGLEDFRNLNSKISMNSIEVVEKQRIVSTFVTDKENLKISERKKQINCGCKYIENVKVVGVPQQDKEELIKLENEKGLLSLKLKQSERQFIEQMNLIESMKGCISMLKRKK